MIKLMVSINGCSNLNNIKFINECMNKTIPQTIVLLFAQTKSPITLLYSFQAVCSMLTRIQLDFSKIVETEQILPFSAHQALQQAYPWNQLECRALCLVQEFQPLTPLDTSLPPSPP